MAPVFPGALRERSPPRGKVYPDEEELVLGVRLVILTPKFPGGQEFSGDSTRLRALGISISRRQAQLEEWV